MKSKHHLWLGGAIAITLTLGAHVWGQTSTPQATNPTTDPPAVEQLGAEGQAETPSPLVEPVELAPPETAQELPGEPPEEAPAPDSVSEPEEITPAQSKTELSIARAVERFGAVPPIGSVTLPAGMPAGMPQMFAVPSQGKTAIHYFSPPVVRPWEDTVLRPRDRFCHQPLYFEEVNLERYGVRRPVVQPLCSAAHFFGSVAMLPYKMSLDRPMRCYQYPHPYLPGVNGFESRRSLRLAPALVQASVVTGMFLVAP